MSATQTAPQATKEARPRSPVVIDGLEALSEHMLGIYLRRRRFAQTLAGHLNKASKFQRWSRAEMPGVETLTDEWAATVARSGADERYQWAWQQLADDEAVTMSRLIGLVRMMCRSTQVLNEVMASGYVGDSYIEDPRILREAKVAAVLLGMLGKCTDAQLDEIECALRAPAQVGGEARIGRLADGGLYAMGVFTRGMPQVAQ